MDRFIRIALRVALRNTVQRERVGCVVVKGGKVLSMEHNLRDRHAEARAIQRIWRSELVRATVYVARPTRDGTVVGLAKPCAACQTMLKEVGIAKVVYTANGGEAWMRL